MDSSDENENVKEANICLMKNYKENKAHFKFSNLKGYLHSDCSNHMIREKNIFSYFTYNKGPYISYTGNKQR